MLRGGADNKSYSCRAPTEREAPEEGDPRCELESKLSGLCTFCTILHLIATKRGCAAVYQASKVQRVHRVGLCWLQLRRPLGSPRCPA